MPTAAEAAQMDHAANGTGPACGRSWPHRLLAASLLSASCLLLSLGMSLEPRDAGYGTHQQLGLPACGFLTTSGIPCATCGMTTAFAHAAHGKLLRAAVTQPAGAAIAVGVAATAIISLYALVMDVALVPMAQALWQARTVLVAAAVILAAWLYKIAAVTGGFGG